MVSNPMKITINEKNGENSRMFYNDIRQSSIWKLYSEQVAYYLGNKLY